MSSPNPQINTTPLWAQELTLPNEKLEQDGLALLETLVPPSLQGTLDHTELLIEPSGTDAALAALSTLRLGLHPEQDHDPSLSVALRLRETLGEGGMARVSLAEQVALGRDVAVKRLREERQDEPSQKLALLREAWLMGSLEHPNIVPIHGLGQDEDGHPVIVMKRISGVAWSRILRNPNAHPSCPHEDRARLRWHLGVLLQVCNALRFAHDRGIIHRDVKPENVMIGAFGEVYLVDWGIAVSLEPDPSGRLPCLLQARGVAGTAAYMAPEMVDDDPSQQSPSSDIYLLGATLHELITGKPPHQGPTLLAALMAARANELPTYPDAVPSELQEIARTAMRSKPQDRFPTVALFSDAISEFLEHYEAIELAHEAMAALEKIEAPTPENQPDEERLIELHRLYGECRFAVKQALKIWPENEEAIQALDASTRAIAHWYIAHGAPRPAQAMLEQLQRPDPELAAQIRELFALEAEHQRTFEALRAEHEDLDPNVGAKTRIKYAMALGTVFGTVDLLYSALHQEDTFTHKHAFVITLALLICSIGFLYYWRSELWSNLINRRYALLIPVSSLVGLAHLAGELTSGNPPQISLRYNLILLASVTAIFAIMSEPTVIIASALYCIGFVFASAYTNATFEIMAACNIICFAFVAFAWHRRAKKASP